MMLTICWNYFRSWSSTRVNATLDLEASCLKDNTASTYSIGTTTTWPILEVNGTVDWILIISSIYWTKVVYFSCGCETCLSSIACSSLVGNISKSIHIAHPSSSDSAIFADFDLSTSIYLYAIDFKVWISDVRLYWRVNIDPDITCGIDFELTAILRDLPSLRLRPIFQSARIIAID